MNPILKPFRIADDGEFFIFLAADLLHAKALYDEYRALDTSLTKEDLQEQYDLCEASIDDLHDVKGFSLFDLFNSQTVLRNPGLISSTLS